MTHFNADARGYPADRSVCAGVADGSAPTAERYQIPPGNPGLVSSRTGCAVIPATTAAEILPDWGDCRRAPARRWNAHGRMRHPGTADRALVHSVFSFNTEASRRTTKTTEIRSACTSGPDGPRFWIGDRGGLKQRSGPAKNILSRRMRRHCVGGAVSQWPFAALALSPCKKTWPDTHSTEQRQDTGQQYDDCADRPELFVFIGKFLVIVSRKRAFSRWPGSCAKPAPPSWRGGAGPTGAAPDGPGAPTRRAMTVQRKTRGFQSS